MTHLRTHGVLTASGRHRLARVTRWRPGLTEVPLHQLLLGGQNGMTARRFATAAGDELWPSRRVVEGPHADLLARADRGGLSADEIIASPYGQMALTTIRHTGRYFAADDAAGVVEQARQFLTHAGGDRTAVPTGDHHSAPGLPVLVVPIEESDCYQVLDGHHRIAMLAHSGASCVPVRMRRGSVTTPLQDLLREMSWLEGGRELYQPLSSPELGGWPTVRKCTDRFGSMADFLRRTPAAPLGGTYLDVASCYGWFVAEMTKLGFRGEGIERDPLGARVGELAYGLDPTSIRPGDAPEVLRATRRQWDVVSCFSLLHHFVLGRGNCDEVELVRLLDKVTGRVLFLDTGQEHERWFRRSLSGWSAEHVARFLRANTTFDEVVDLGPDEDDVAPYDGNYGRHLFACVRTGRGEGS